MYNEQQNLLLFILEKYRNPNGYCQEKEIEEVLVAYNTWHNITKTGKGKNIVLNKTTYFQAYLSLF